MYEEQNHIKRRRVEQLEDYRGQGRRAIADERDELQYAPRSVVNQAPSAPRGHRNNRARDDDRYRLPPQREADEFRSYESDMRDHGPPPSVNLTPLGNRRGGRTTAVAPPISNSEHERYERRMGSFEEPAPGRTGFSTVFRVDYYIDGHRRPKKFDMNYND